MSDTVRIETEIEAKTARDGQLPFDAEEYGDEIPNALTVETFNKLDRGEDIHHAKDLADLFRQLKKADT